MRTRPDRIDRLPEQYFARLLARVATAAAQDGDEVIDLGRGNPDIGPPQHVIDALAEAANDHSAHGYPPFRGIPELKDAVAARYRELYGVELDPEREIAVVPGTKTAIVEVAMCLAERGSTMLLPDPGYPDYTSGANSITSAFMRTLELFFDDDVWTFTVTTTVAGQGPRVYERFSAVADDVVDARIFMGIHFRFADAGARRQGKQAANWAFSHVLRPLD